MSSVDWPDGTTAGAMYSPRLVKEVLNTLGKQLVDDGRLSRVGHTRMARRRLRSARKSARPSQSQGRKERGDRLGVETEALRLRS